MYMPRYERLVQPRGQRGGPVKTEDRITHDFRLSTELADHLTRGCFKQPYSYSPTDANARLYRREESRKSTAMR